MELWDIYDENCNLTGRTQERGAPQAPGEYHLSVSVVAVNSRREVLCTLRSMDKPNMPGVWESPGGGVLAGETSLEAAVRELLEETGISAAPEEMVFLSRRKADGFNNEGFFMDTYGLRRDISADELVLQPHEVDAAQWLAIDEWERRARSGEILAGDYTDEFFAAVRDLTKRPLPELLDIYDAQGNRTGRLHWRGTELSSGEFCLAAAVVIYNQWRQVLCSLRSPEKKVLPNTWECPGGSALAGETSRQGAVRELREETGIAASPEELQFILRVQGRFSDGGELLDLYALRWDFPSSEVVLQPGETVDARWFAFEEWEQKVRAGEIWAGDTTDKFFAAVRALAAAK